MESDRSFLFAAYTKKESAFAHSTSLPRAPASQDTDHDKTWESVCSTNMRVLAYKFEGRRWSVSRDLSWDVGTCPIAMSFFPIGNDLLFCTAKS